MDKEALIRKLDAMHPSDVVAMVRKALEESGISYEKGKGKIEFNGLQSDSNVDHNCLSFQRVITVCDHVDSFDPAITYKKLYRLDCSSDRNTEFSISDLCAAAS